MVTELLDTDMAHTNYDIVCISSLDWNHPSLPCTQLHLMRQFASRGHRVFFVNSPLRWIYEYKELRSQAWLQRKLTDWRKGFVQVGPNFYSFTPPPQVPQNRVQNVKAYQTFLRFNQKTFLNTFRSALKPYQVERPLLWTALEPMMGAAVLGKLGERLSIYHCTDELTGFNTYSSHYLQLEREVIANSDLLITTSNNLRDNKKLYNPHAYSVPNAADVEHFKQALQPLPEPSDLAAIPHPRFGFVGQFEYRFHTELVYEAALARPNWQFVLIGPILSGYGENPPLLKLPNVHAIGPRSNANLPAYLRALDVCLIPYKLDKLTAGIYPLKLHEYLAAGKPVLATRLPSLEPFEGTIALVDSPADFVNKGELAIQSAQDPAAIASRVEVAERNSWQNRIETIVQLIEQHLVEKEGSVSDPVRR